MASQGSEALQLEHTEVGGESVNFASIGRGVPVLMLPGGGGPSRMLWSLSKPRDFITALAARHRVLLFDFRSGGLSEERPPDPDELLAEVVARFVAVFDAAAVDHCHIVASYMTAIPAVALAARHPERVASLLLWNGVLAGTSIAPDQGVRSMNELVRGKDSNLASGAFAGANGMVGDGEAFQQYREMFKTYPGLQEMLKTGQIAWRALSKTDGSAEANRIQCRTLVVDPEAAVAPGPGAVEELARAIPGSLLVQTAGAATSPHLAEHSVAVPLVLDWLAKGSTGERGPRDDRGRLPLTPREREVLGLIEAGLTNRAIAERLVLSIHTVNKHVSNALRKLQASNRTEAAVQAREAGLLD